MIKHLAFSTLKKSDVDEIVTAFEDIGWNKPQSIYETYFSEQSSGIRSVIIAKVGGQFCGYVTVKWLPSYPGFSKNNTPEIMDLNVLPNFQKQGIGTQLIKKCEEIALEKQYSKIGLGVGLVADYGNAQKLYVQLGYKPDGKGLHYKDHPVSYNESVIADDYLVIFLIKEING